MSKKTFLVAGLALVLFGAGCSTQMDPYIPAEAPSGQALSQMNDVQKMQGIQQLLVKYPMPTLSLDQRALLTAAAHHALDQGSVDRAGSFRAGLYPAQGKAQLVKNGTHYQLVLSDDFGVSQGPFLLVDLSQAVGPKTTADFTGAGSVQLELLKSATGGQVYDIPDNINVSQYKSVVIYCKPYQAIFAVASLE